MIRVAEADDGAVLDPGERLVTLDGKLRRWDGFAAEDDGAATAEQLVRANRLEALARAVPAAETTVAAADAALATIAAQIAEAQDNARALQAEQLSTENVLRQALRDADRAEDALARCRAAAEALGERGEAAAQERALAAAELKAADEARSALPEGDQHRGVVAALTSESDSLRQYFARAQADLSGLDQKIAQQRERRAVAQAEIRGWQERSGEAERRIADMNKRSAEIAGELEAMDGKPDISHARSPRLKAIAQRLARSWRGCRPPSRPAKRP